MSLCFRPVYLPSINTLVIVIYISAKKSESSDGVQGATFDQPSQAWGTGREWGRFWRPRMG